MGNIIFLKIFGIGKVHLGVKKGSELLPEPPKRASGHLNWITTLIFNFISLENSKLSHIETSLINNQET